VRGAAGNSRPYRDRADSLRVRHSKTGACSFLPLMAPVGEALLDYLRRGRPVTDRREVFIRS